MLPLAGWRALYKYVNKYTDAVITISDAVNHKYIARFQTPRFLIYNGLPDVNEHFAPENRDTFNLIQSGIISPVKGVDVSVKAIQILHKQGYENVHLYLAGKGDLEFCREDYENVKPYVHLLGYVNNLNEIRQKKMDAELVCSKSEAFGRVTIEAMKNGMIVVGADTGGTKELIHDGKDGFLFRMGDANDLAEKIRMIIDQKVDLQYIKENALLNAKEFSIAKCANSIRTLYADILKGE
jgi:glycosyltransferase involved in cell wall biosynthesis